MKKPLIMGLFPQGKFHFFNFSYSGSIGIITNKKLSHYCRLPIVIMLLTLVPFLAKAQPTYVGMSSALVDNSGVAGPTVTVATAPVGTMNAGDLVVLFAQYRGTGVTFTIPNTGGQTWAPAIAPAGANNQTYAIYWCRYNGAWTGGDPSVSVTAGANGLTAIMYVYRPTVGTKSWSLNAGPSGITTASNTTTAIALNSITPSANNSVTMAFWYTAVTNTWSGLTAGWTKPGSAQYRNTTTLQSQTGAYKLLGTAAATGTVTQTRSAGTQISNGVVLSWAEGNATYDLCSNAFTLTPAATCVTTAGLLDYATYTSDGGPSGCSSNAPDIWYKFVATNSSVRITNTLTAGSGQRRTEAFRGSCGSLVSIGCSGNSDNLDLNGLTIGQTYYIRVYSQNNAPYGFNLCVQNIAAINGTCATATVLTPGTSCAPIPGSLYGANQTSPSGGCGNYYDVWYTFTAPAGYNFANITVTPTGSANALTASNTFIEAFKSTCGSINGNSLSCSNIGIVRTMSIASGTTYIFRVYTTANPSSGTTNYNFNICITLSNSFIDRGGRMNEVFKQQILSSPNVLNDPWEVLYSPTDNKLWLTESKGYKVYTMNTDGSGKTTVLDISQGSTFLTLTDRIFNCQFANGSGAQGGLAGMVLHPNFGKGTGQDFVYISYIYSQGVSVDFTPTNPPTGNTNNCVWFTNRLVRFTYSGGVLGSPVSLCDTLPGGNDHNSQRIGIAKVGGVDYLFYASGDLGAGQLDCFGRLQRAQLPQSYEGKILRFNLDPVGPQTALDSWIPANNPYNGVMGIVKSAVWATGIRNNQGFAYDPELNLLYGSSHGPYSDDEINIIEEGRNYGHPMVLGYVSDGNYNSPDTTVANQRYSGGAPFTLNGGVSRNWAIGSESAQRDVINATAPTSATVPMLGKYKDPLFSAYAELASGPGSVRNIWLTNPPNGGWPSEGWSGLDIYTNSMIPGWKKSLVASSLKWGRLIRLKLGTNGQITLPSNNAVNNAGDTICYFGSINRFRDLAFGPNGRDIYVIMDKSTTTSGPSAQWPVVPACQGCLQKYTFLGYNVDAADNYKSTIPTSIGVNQGVSNTCETMNKVAINAANDNRDYWVPITDQNSNIVAEIYAMGQTLDTVRTTVYHNTDPIRLKNGKKYLDRNITITPDVQPGGEVRIRLYITKEEFDLLAGSSGSGVTSMTDLKIVKNNDPCGSAMTANINAVTMDLVESFGTDAYVLQGRISSFSTFYFGSTSMATLPLEMLSFTGVLQNNNSLLNWETAQEVNTTHFVVERSVDAVNYTKIGTVSANGNPTNSAYSYIDYDAGRLPSTAVYYRLKIVDRDGQYTYSKIVHIMLPYLAGKVIVSPNPVVDVANVTITSNATGNANWKVIDQNGRVVMRGVANLQVGNNQMSINMNRQPAGIYFLDVSGSGINYQTKMQKL